MTRRMLSATTGLALAGALALVLTGCGSSGNGGAAGAATTVPAATGTGGANEPVITAVGHGKVEGTPDVMTITFGVQTSGPTAQAALADTGTRSQNLVALLKRNGVADKDLQTTDLSVFPNFDSKGQKIVGYTVSNSVTAKLHKISSAGPLIDAATFVVGDAIRLNGISFSIDDTSALVARARTDAVKKAVAQAKELAAAAGVGLGKVRSIDESTGAPPQPITFAGDAARAAVQHSVAIEAGSQDVTLDVKVVYAINE